VFGELILTYHAARRILHIEHIVPGQADQSVSVSLLAHVEAEAAVVDRQVLAGCALPFTVQLGGQALLPGVSRLRIAVSECLSASAIYWVAHLLL
jgi:hypothetical protein